LPDSTNYEVLIDSGILNRDSCLFFLNYDNRPCIYLKGKIVELDSLEQNGYEPILISDSHIRQLCYLSGDTLVTLTGNLVVSYTKQGSSDTLSLPHDSLRMSNGSEGTVYLYGFNTENGQYDLYKYQTNAQTAEKLFTISEPIISVSGMDQWAFLATEHRIFFLGEGKAHQVLYSKDPIKALAYYSDKGYFFSTDSIVGYSFGNNKELTFMYKGASSLWVANEELYLLSEDGMLAKVAPIDHFDDFAHVIDSIRIYH
jgi:hypothetical protein